MPADGTGKAIPRHSLPHRAPRSGNGMFRLCQPRFTSVAVWGSNLAARIYSGLKQVQSRSVAVQAKPLLFMQEVAQHGIENEHACP